MTTNHIQRDILRPGRVVALALIAVLIGGLLYLRFAPGDGPVSVPAGAKAGDLVLEPCEYPTENGSYRADCGTLVVPENRNNAQSRLIALPVTRVRALSAQPGEPLFRLEGGPGATNMRFGMASRFAGDRDVVLVGYRGVDGSSVLDCPEVTSALKHSSDVLGEKSFDAYADGFRSCAERLTDDGVDLAGYSLTQQVDDLEAARVALGYGQIDLLSESAGTRTAMIYSWRYPKSIRRSVMLAVNPPGHYLWDGKTTDGQIARYAELCAKDDSCRQRTDDLAASMKRTAEDLPERWGFLPIKEANARIASFMGLFETTTKMGPANGPMTMDSWLSAAEGDASGLWFASLAGDYLFPEMFTWGQYAAIGVQDAHVANPYFAAGGDHGSILGNPVTEFAWGGGRLGDAWPANRDDAEYSRVRTSTVETLLIGGELDFSTPPQVATEELLPYLPSGHQVVLAGFGHSLSFWNDQPEAGTHLVNTFLAGGQVDDSQYEPAAVDFTPGMTHTMLAKIIAGTMMGLALVTVLSLLWMARRVHGRRAFGPKASATLRSLYASVLGLGGWFLGALIVMTTTPGVPLDDEVLAVLAVGVPVGLGIYLAWVQPDLNRGLLIAGAGALVGAWLGFHATAGPSAVFTAIAGAVAGANLTLILLDMARDRSAGDGPVTRTTVDELSRTTPFSLSAR